MALLLRIPENAMHDWTLTSRAWEVILRGKILGRIKSKGVWYLDTPYLWTIYNTIITTMNLRFVKSLWGLCWARFTTSIDLWEFWDNRASGKSVCKSWVKTTCNKTALWITQTLNHKRRSIHRRRTFHCCDCCISSRLRPLNSFSSQEMLWYSRRFSLEIGDSFVPRVLLLKIWYFWRLEDFSLRICVELRLKKSVEIMVRNDNKKIYDSHF